MSPVPVSARIRLTSNGQSRDCEASFSYRDHVVDAGFDRDVWGRFVVVGEESYFVFSETETSIQFEIGRSYPVAVILERPDEAAFDLRRPERLTLDRIGSVEILTT